MSRKDRLESLPVSRQPSRNLTIGQVNGNFVLRCRFSDEGQASGGLLSNGEGGWLPPIETADQPLQLNEDMQLVARLDSNGVLSLWVNEQEYQPNDAARAEIERLQSDISSWTLDFGLGLGNEFGDVNFHQSHGRWGERNLVCPDGRPWLGQF